MNILTRNWKLPRRKFLRGAGVALTLPWLNAMGAATTPTPKRAVFCMWGLGINGRDFTPKETGADYQLTPILEPLAKHKTRLHGNQRAQADSLRRPWRRPDLPDRHQHPQIRQQTPRFLRPGTRRGDRTGHPLPLPRARHPARNGFRQSPGQHPFLDQERDADPGGKPSPHSLRPAVPPRIAGNSGPARSRIRRAFQRARFRAGGSRITRATLGKRDQEKLDEYLTGIRDLEASMQEQKSWLYKPKPQVEPIDFGSDQGLDPSKGGLEYRRYQRFMFDVITLALQTDSTRVVSYQPRMDNSDGTGAWKVRGQSLRLPHHDAPRRGRRQAQVVHQGGHSLHGRVGLFSRQAPQRERRRGHPAGSHHGGLQFHWRHHQCPQQHQLPALLCGGSKIGVQHRGHLVKEDDYLGNLWQTMFEVMGVPIPENFQGGEADGSIGELI